MVTSALLAVAAIAAHPAPFKGHVSRGLTKAQLTVSWTTDRTLKPGWYYEVYLAPPNGCPHLGFAVTVRAKKSTRVRAVLKSPTSWCKGKSYYAIDVVTPKGTPYNIFTQRLTIN